MLNYKKHPSKTLALCSLIVLLLGALVVGLAYPGLVRADTYTVTNTNASGPGSLYQSILDANAHVGADTITFAPQVSGTIVLTGSLPAIADTLTIAGPGEAALAVSGNNAARVFYVNASVAFTLTQLTVANGNAVSASINEGGGMCNLSGNLRLANVTFISNSADRGGGLKNDTTAGSPTLTNVTFRANSATNGGAMYNRTSSPALTNVAFISNTTTYYGGGMYNVLGSSPTLANVAFSGNSTGSGGSGGGMYNEGSSPTLTDVTFSGNSADFGAGLGNVFSSNPTLTRVTFTSNSAIYGGGGMYNHTSSPTLADVAFISNAATYTNPSASGGGMYNEASSPVLTNVTFISNTVTYHGGGMYNQSSSPKLTDVTFSANSATDSTYGDGGGMYNTSSSPVLTNVAFISNTAAGYEGGGMFNTSSNSTLTNVTFSGNSAAFYGGGLCNRQSSPTLTNVTFSGNSTMDGWGGGMYSQFGSPQVRNSIFWGDIASYGEIYNDSSTPVISDSVVQDGCPSGAACTNVITTNPQLGALGYYGGRTPTLPLLAGSSAFDTGNDGVCPATDQRGVARPQGAHCDIGAFEASAEIAVLGNNTEIADGDTTPSTTDHTDFGGGPLGQALTRTFTISNSGGMTLTLTGSPVVSLTGAGADNFSVVVQPATTSVSPNITTTFQVRFTPPVTGTRVATVTIANNDSDENPYDFAIQGAGLVPEIAVLGNGQVIADGDTTPSANDHTDFGNVALNQALTRTFTISNSSGADLTLTGSPVVSLTGAGVGDFSVVVQPATTSVSPNITTTFQIRFTPSVTGTRVATVTIPNNDSDENPYDFAIQGIGTTVSGVFSYLPVILKNVGP